MVRKKVNPLKKSLLQPTTVKGKSGRIFKNPTFNVDLKCTKELWIGKLLIGATNNVLPDTYNKCKVIFLCKPDEVDYIHLEFDTVSVLVAVMIDTIFLREMFYSKIFSIQFEINGENLNANIYFTSLPLLKFNTRIGNTLKTLFQMIYNISEEFEFDENKCGAKHLSAASEIVSLYKLVSEKRKKVDALSTDSSMQHFQLKPKLRLYQEDAVKWMVLREKIDTKENDTLHPLFMKLTLNSDLEVFYDKYSGYVTNKKPTILGDIKGGILADEMGLGKTVEVLACILNHPLSEENFNKAIDLDHKSDISNSPVIEKLKKNAVKRKSSDLQDKSKVVKVEHDTEPEYSVYSPQGKSATKVALEMWYRAKLSEVSIKPKFQKIAVRVQCVCGEDNVEKTINCEECKILQHYDCFGYITESGLGPFLCSQCWKNQPLLKSKATLIVTPISLRTQWCKEISRHVAGDLRVLVYEGSNTTLVYPTYLKSFDVVLTTYNVLQNELRLSEEGKEFQFRSDRRYSVRGCPLSNVHWWRLCLDEAQTVETPSKMISTMAKKLLANFRWAVTGTPISKDISDIYGLLDYLQIEPYNELDTWNHLLYTPYLKGNVEPLTNFLSQVMWRSSKDEVINQINIPKQTVYEHWLEFSAVEKYFYKREHELSSKAFLDKLQNMNPALLLEKLDKGTLKKVMLPLLSLRQACTHPNSTRGRYLTSKKQGTSMKDLLEALIDKNSTESEESLRLVVSSLNGLAGISLLLQNPEDAAEEYRKVMQLSARFSEDVEKSNLSIDKLQLIHTMHNLADVIENYSFIPPTLRDSSLRKECLDMEVKYIEKFMSQTIEAYRESEQARLNIENARSKFLLKNGQWYSDAFDWILITNFFGDFSSRVYNLLETTNVKCEFDYKSHRIVLLKVAQWDEELTDLRNDVVAEVYNLFTYSTENPDHIDIDKKLVQLAMDCHLRPQQFVRKKCPICITDTTFKKYEYRLFTILKRKEDQDLEKALKGSWKPSAEEVILKATYALLKAKNANEQIIKDGESHINLIDHLKKEFKEMRRLWTYIDQQICAQDELDMCKSRLSLKGPEEEKSTSKESTAKSRVLKTLTYKMENKLERIYMLGIHELDYQRTLLQSEEQQSLARLEKCLGVQSYLETLREQQYEGISPDPCPICKNVLEQHWSILNCGHSYCLDCIQKLLEQTNGTHFLCSVCRNKHSFHDISYIKAGTSEETDTDEVKLKGNYSTKIEAAIKLLIDLKNKDKDVKILVFSTWISILKVLKGALETNGIKSELLLRTNLEQRIENFKDGDKNITALLLPISLGGKGLNLIEATHVVLVEPLLNPADELQALGRVHRIGQTRETFVHKFFIKNTIEESIHNATSTNVDSWDKNTVTLRQLTDLFITAKEDLNPAGVEIIHENAAILDEQFSEDSNSVNIEDDQNNSSSLGEM